MALQKQGPMIPQTSSRPGVSRPALAIILASVILAGVLGIVTWRNMHREERLMSTFLRDEGLTLIHAFEAASRTAMMMNMPGDSLPMLVKETASEGAVAYVAIADASGRVLTEAGLWPPGEKVPTARILASKGAFTRLCRDAKGGGVYEVAREFKPLDTLLARSGNGRQKGRWQGSGGMRTTMQGDWRKWCGRSCVLENGGEKRVIVVGLYTAAFEADHRQDLRQSMLVGAVLLLLGSAGFYFLLLSQHARVARRTLDNMELYTRNVIESIPAGLITLDTTGHIVSLNGEAKELFGRPEVNAEGMTLAAFTDAAGCPLAALLDKEQAFLERPLECRRPDGETLPLKVSASPLHGHDGEALGTVLVVHDLRELRAMEEALERSRRLASLGRMAAGIAHEVRNPLGTLRGFAQFFARRPDCDPAGRQYAELMIGEVDRLNRTVSALLQFARPREPEWQQVDLGALLGQTARLLKDEMATQQVTFTVEPPPTAVMLRADPDLLIQLLINLLQNALAATLAGGEIRLAGQATQDGVLLRVIDSGKGMTDQELAHMFDPFFSGRKGGTGLGLSVVHQIVEQHRGRIEVVSEPGKGTDITVILPHCCDPAPTTL
jgi:two-component system sensor histidine kinase HydH